MTRKDYIIIAKAFKAVYEANDFCDERQAAIADAAGAVAYLLECDNPRFDRSRFLNACGTLCQSVMAIE